MTAKRFHLGWFMNFTPPVWEGPFSGDVGRTWADGSFYIDMARTLERAGFDYMMLEDSLMVSDAYQGSSRADLRSHLYAPKHDPLLLIPLLAAATTRLGIVATASTSFYAPYTLARAMTTLDHLTHGRVGWNVVTSSEHRSAQNYGMTELFEHDQRYERADEFIEVVEKLWSSWDADAVVMDRASGTYVDHTKVRTIDHEGQYFSVRGPLNALPPVQGRPVICQAGGSPRGRELAARHADTIITQARGLDNMKSYREDIHRRMAGYGRKPDEAKLLFIVNPVLGATSQEAQAKLTASRADPDRTIEVALAHLSALTEIDFAQFDLDAPLPAVSTNGHRRTLEEFVRIGAGGKTLRQIALGWVLNAVDLVGTPDEVAGQMEEAMDYVGGDGFLISGAMSRQYISEIADGLVPALQRRGLTREAYSHATFRDNLLAF